MRRRLSPLWIGVIAVALAFIVLIGAYGTYLASEAGRLPWQEEPTRIPITPFADIPGFGGTPVPTETSRKSTGTLLVANPTDTDAAIMEDAHITEVVIDSRVEDNERHGSEGS